LDYQLHFSASHLESLMVCGLREDEDDQILHRLKVLLDLIAMALPLRISRFILCLLSKLAQSLLHAEDSQAPCPSP